MNQAGERKNSSVIPSFNRTIRIDFRGAKISYPELQQDHTDRFPGSQDQLGCRCSDAAGD